MRYIEFRCGNKTVFKTRVKGIRLNKEGNDKLYVKINKFRAWQLKRMIAKSGPIYALVVDENDQ